MTAAPWLLSAASALGTSEAAGPADNPDVLAMHSAVDGSALPDAVPWCSSFVVWALARSGLSVPAGVTRRARSWLRAAELDTLELERAPHGAIAVLRRGTSSWQGHVGFLVGRTRSLLLLLGGNQQDQVTVEPYASGDLLGLRWPRQGPPPGPPLR